MAGTVKRATGPYQINRPKGHVEMAGGSGYKDRKPKDPDGSHITWWHAVMGHPGDRTAARMLENGLGEINGVKITKKMYGQGNVWCDACAKGKCKRSPHKARKRADEGWPDRPNMLHAFDSTGRMLKSWWGHQYSTIIKDHHDGKTWTYAHSKKDHLPRVLAHHEHVAKIDGRLTKRFHELGGIHDLRVMAYRSDNAPEVKHPGELARRRLEGIASEWTVPNDGHGQQNAVAERGIGLTRTIANILIHSNMHNLSDRQARRLWPYAHQHAAHLQLLWPTQHNQGGAAPGEKRYAAGKGSNNENWRSRLLHVWGSRMIVRREDSEFKKHELRGRSVYYLGVPTSFGPGYLGWDKHKPTKHPQVYYNVTFQEDPDVDRRGQDRRDESSCPDESEPESNAISDIEPVEDIERIDGSETEANMGPATETASDSGDDTSDSDADDVEEKTRMRRGRGPRKRWVDKEDGTDLLLWSSGEENLSDSCDGDIEDVDLDTWYDGTHTKVEAPPRHRQGQGPRTKRKRRRRKGHQPPRPLEVHQADLKEDDGWAARMYIPGKENSDSPTFRKLWKMLRDEHGMEESIEEFMVYNGQEADGDTSLRPRVFEPSDGTRRWVWAPTKLVGDKDGTSIPDVEDERSDAPIKIDAAEDEAQSAGDEGGKTPESARSSGGATGSDNDESDESRNDSESAAPRRPTRLTEAPNRTEEAHRAMLSAEQRENRRKRPNWYAALCKEDPRVDTDPGGAAETERRFERATALITRVTDMAAKSVHVGTKKGRRLARRAKSAFVMAACLIAVSVANLVRGIENVKQRDFPEPRNYKDAINSEFSDLWSESIQLELNNLESHKIWEWSDLPPGRRCIDTTWRFRAKATKTGLIDKLKSRLCARGFRQMHGYDFTETHAPVTVLSAWRANVAECANYGWKYDLWDISAAYLTAELLEEIYCLPPEGMVIPDGMENKVLRLRKALYGLKQAGRAWNKKLTKWLLDFGFTVSDADPSLYIIERNINGEGHHIRLNVHVDDAFATYTNAKWYSEFKAELTKEFKLSSSADGDVFLGITVERLRDGAIKISQRRYVDDIVAAFLDIGDKKEAKVPYVASWKLTKEMGPQTAKEKKEMEKIPYRRLIGMLLHLSNCTRPDIAAAVGILGKFNATPGMQHFKAGLEVVRYLRATANYGVIYGRRREEIPYVPLCGYSDASWGDDPDDRTSRSGTMLWSWGGPIEWRSKKQSSQALSSCEAEYMAACAATQSMVWGRRLFRQFGYEDLGIFDGSVAATEQEMEGHRPAVIYEDNTGCIEWSKNPVDHQRAKHIDLKYHYVRAKVRDGEVKLVHCPTDEMMADLLTKYLAAPRFAYLRDKMLGVE